MNTTNQVKKTTKQVKVLLQCECGGLYDGPLEYYYGVLQMARYHCINCGDEIIIQKAHGPRVVELSVR